MDHFAHGSCGWAGTTFPCIVGHSHRCFAASASSFCRSIVLERPARCLSIGQTCGPYNFGSQHPVEPETIRRMATSMFHRGPDDEGFHLEGPLGLGFRRLSIIDLAGGHQPMSDQEGSVWVAFNGEIYNFPELKKELE